MYEPVDSMSSTTNARPAPESHPEAVTIVHTSDVHIGTGHRTEHDDEWPERAIADLARMAELGREHGASAMVIVGDFFDNNRVREPLVEATGEALGRAGMPVVILPGNHDPYMAESVYVKFAEHFPENVHVIQREEGELIALPEVGLQVWGQAHADYYDFNPVEHAPAWQDDGDRPLWRIALAHGYYVKSEYETKMSYQIHPHDLLALQAHYVGLGHLELYESVGPEGTTAYYSGAPDRSGGATIVDLTPAGVSVRHVLSGVPPAAQQHTDGGPGFFGPGVRSD
jgi:DNA repair exonuclease SbcCD nuclease subunit